MNIVANHLCSDSNKEYKISEVKNDRLTIAHCKRYTTQLVRKKGIDQITFNINNIINFNIIFKNHIQELIV